MIAEIKHGVSLTLLVSLSLSLLYVLEYHFDMLSIRRLIIFFLCPRPIAEVGRATP